MKNGFRISLLAVSTFTLLGLVGCGATSMPAPTTMPTNMMQGGGMMSGQPSATNSASSQTVIPKDAQDITLTVLPGGKLGPDGKMHDAYSPADFTVEQGMPVKLTIYNYDTMKHSFTSSALNLNVQANPSPKNGVPGITTVTFTPSQTGDFNWQCIDPCDLSNAGWAMSHDGYMAGVIHVTAPAQKQFIYLTIKDGLHYASDDGKLHDSYSPADFSVKTGEPVQVTVYNYDAGEHSFTAPDLGVNQVFKGAAKTGVPTVTTFTFTPQKAGKYAWHCVIQCDGNGWAMSHDGYMSGFVTVQN